ncbi:MAG TPA: hypothetical protein PKU94_06120 [Candidatus Hydrothermia bacterium]|mgnify:CR=1 FL=1|nr:hypothetical protein [Candidatus Hydrothermia bacterium]
MKSTPEYYLEIRRSKVYEVNQIETDLGVIQNEELRVLARKLLEQKKLEILDLDFEYDFSTIRGEEDVGPE